MSCSPPQPVSKLSPEVLSAIFECCLTQTQFLTPAPLQAPLLLLHVCLLWRQVAISTPQLWCSLRLTHNIPNASHAHGHWNQWKQADTVATTAIRLWLSRAASLPLSISLDRCNIKQQLIDVLLQYLTRCRHLEIIDIEPWVEIHLHAHHHFRDLETLHFRCSPSGRVVDISAALSSAPKLREVLWEDGRRYVQGSYGVQRALTYLPWPQLKRLILGDGTKMRASSAILLDCLAQCPILEHADLNVVYLDTVPRLPVLLSSLFTLRLNAMHEDPGRNMILNYLNVPNLRELTLEGGLLDVPDLVSFFQRSSFMLETLQLRNVFISLHSLIAALELICQSLKFLAIAHAKTVMTGTYLEVLTRFFDRLYPCRFLELSRQTLDFLVRKYPKIRDLLYFLPDLICVALPPCAPAWMVGWRLPLAVGYTEEGTTLKSPRVTYMEVDNKILQRFGTSGLKLNLDVDMDVPVPLGLEYELEIIASVYPGLYAWGRFLLQVRVAPLEIEKVARTDF